MLGIPTHLAPRVNAWSTIRAFHAAAVGALVVAAVIVVLYRLSAPPVDLVGTLVPIAVTGAMVAVHARIGTWRSATAFLVVGALATCWYGFAVEREFGDVTYVASYMVSLAIVPLVLVGGSGAVPAKVAVWSAIGFVVGRAATLVGTLLAGGEYHVAVLAWLTLALVMGVVASGARTTARSRRVQPELLRAAREEHVSAYRAGVEAEAAAILHDTVLNHLNALAIAPSGPMDAQLAKTVDADLTMLAGREWLAPQRPRSGPEIDAFDRMLADQRRTGLDIDVTGDPSAIAKLDDRAVVAVIRAVAQCLANVRKHAGTDTAEVSVFDDGASCSVMVVDGGRGFDEDETAPDRLGLRNSVRQRVERVGGDVQVWSSLGTGTSVLMTVPFTAPDVATDDDGPVDPS